MSVKQGLLAILDQGPCYGYQLRAEFERRTGSTWPLNVGQIYNTLERLERDGLVAKGDVDAQGHVYWQITDAGREGVREWWASPVERAATARDELAIKIAVATTLPGVDIDDMIDAQRRVSVARRDEWDAEAIALEHGAGSARGEQSPETLARALIVDAMRFAADADVRWLDHIAQRLAAHPRDALALELSTEKPARGRPRRSLAS